MKKEMNGSCFPKDNFSLYNLGLISLKRKSTSKDDISKMNHLNLNRIYISEF